MKRLLIVIAIVSLVLALPVIFLWGGVIGYNQAMQSEGRSTTVSRLSPDETMLARLIEISLTQSLGRHFKVQIQSKDIFVSPEEEEAGLPGTERLIWSKDGTKLLLVGRHFFVKDDLFLESGDQLFFLYDVLTGRGWCNSEAPVPFPPLKAEMIEGLEFTEPVILKQRDARLPSPSQPTVNGDRPRAPS